MDTDVLRYFKVAAQLGNISRAAEELHISQPTLTVSIQKLEKNLGVTLFERSKKGISLTVLGQQVYKYAEEVLEAWETLQRETERSSEGVRGSVRLGVHPSVACYYLPLFLPDLLGKHPLLSVNLIHDLSRNILQKILNNQIDVGLVINPEKNPDIVVKEVAQDEVTIWKRKSGSIDDVLLLDPSLFQTEWILKKLQKKGVHFPRKIESNSLEVIASLLRAGVGHAILPKRVATQMPFAIAESYPEIPAFKDSLCLVYRPSFRKTGVGRAFIDAVSAN